MKRATLIVSGQFAYRSRRVAAARARELGLEIVTLPGLATRLCGGFASAADPATLVQLVSGALAELTFTELDPVKHKPGMARAVLASLNRLWAAGLSVTASGRNPRFQDLVLVEHYLRGRLPIAALLPNDLVERALGNVGRAAALLGPIHLDRMIDIDPIWRPLVIALTKVVDVTWSAPGIRDRSWFSGTIVPLESEATSLVCEVCADPRAEVVEALRWARALLSDGVTQASDIAIASADTSNWDEHMVVLAADADIPVHFASGRPALSSRAGQACAALADVMMNGLAQDRIRRLSLLSPFLIDALPSDWLRGIPDEAGLFETAHWRRAFDTQVRTDGINVGPIVLPIIEALERGPAAAVDLGNLLLGGPSLSLWQEALRLAPAAAIEMTLSSLRVADEHSPASAIAWTTAADLVGAPRKHMRLIGLSSRSWPRADAEDPLLPGHIMEQRSLVPFPRLERDRIAFDILTTHPGAAITLSRSRRSSEGSFLAKSALIGREVTERVLARTRSPEHAFSEGDRLLARPEEARRLERINRVVACWSRWFHEFDPTSNDGLVRADHPVILRTLREPQSATSLRRLLRDPLGYLWRHALGMTAPQIALQPLQLDAPTFGTLVHELLRIAVDRLEQGPTLVRASPEEIDSALATAAVAIGDAWPLRQAVPPRLLWLDTIGEARSRAYRGLTLDERFGPGTRSWSEVGFGDSSAIPEQVDPWSTNTEVTVGSRSMRLRGRIDRVDIKPDRRAVRMTDYKTGDAPREQKEVVLGGGAEVQRTLYALAIKRLVPEVTQVVSRLAYLDSDRAPIELKGDALDEAETALVRYIDVAADQLSEGLALPGPDAFGRFNDLRLALPANLDSYKARKEEGFRTVQYRLATLWGEK